MAFIDQYYRAGHPLARHRQLFDWQYGNGPGHRYNIVLAVEPSSSEVLGMIGFIDSRRYDEALGPDNCIWLTMWQVNPRARIPSLGLVLLKFLQEHIEHKILASSGIRAALKPMYRAMGFEVTDLSHHVLLNPAVAEHHLAVIPRDFSPLPAAVSSGVQLRLLTNDNFSLETDQFPARFDRTPTKSAVYFYNRYVRHPFYEYQVYLVREQSRPVGLVACRIVAQDGWRAMRIVDVLLDPRHLVHLGAPLRDLIVAADCEYGDLLQSGLDESLLLAAGFGTVTKGSGVIVPNYFEPFVRENVQISACFRGADRATFVVCKADCDQDRPNLP
jgi:hypothetical protein